jgi:carbon storage regulator
MLVLSRKRGETVCIGQDITVKFLAVRGQSVKIGIDAPLQVRILRGELSVETMGPSR